MVTMIRRRIAILWLALAAVLSAAETVTHPFQGITYIERSENEPRNVIMHIVTVDLTAPGIRFKLTPPGGPLETIRQTTLDFLRQEHAQIAINAHYFLPFPSQQAGAKLVGFAASEGKVYSAFETPEQSYALVRDAPAINIDSRNRAAIVHRDPAFADGLQVVEKVEVYNAVSGSAQIVTGGVKTIPQYREGELTLGGSNNYSAQKPWYEQINARSAIGITRDRRTLVLFTVDVRGGSAGMRVSEVADILIRDYAVFNALNLDGGGSTTLAVDDRIVNTSSDNPNGRKVGSNLAVFAASTVH
jgi:exopolysaccharide biosynthesis protein